MSTSDEIEILEFYKKVIKSPYKKMEYTWYETDFRSLYELHKYITSNPTINEKIFTKLSSLNPYTKNNDFYEMEYEDAVKCLLGGYSRNIDKLLELKSNLKDTIYFPSNRRNVVKSFTGSRICPNSFVNNSPKRYYKLERVLERKFITLHVNLGCPGQTSINSILNRGALIYNLITMLEENNYSVELDTFCLFKLADEIVHFKVRLKDINETLSIENGVFPLTSSDFVRRIIFRVIETLNVKEKSWGFRYGTFVNGEEVKELKELGDKDIYIGSPDEIGIKGKKLNDDINNFLDYVDIKKYVRVKVNK